MISRIVHFIFAILSIILGIVIAVLFADGSLPYIRANFKILLVLSTLLILVYIVILVLAYFINNPKFKCCLFIPGIPLAISSIGTLVVSIIALATSIHTSILSIQILVGFGGFFFSLMILSLISIVCCFARNLKHFPIV